MTVFDLLLLLVLLITAITILVAFIQLVTGRFRPAGRTLAILVSGLACYMAVICVVSLTENQRVRYLGEPDCADDWCFAAEKVHFHGSDLIVDFKVWSRAKRVTQREYGVHPFLVDDQGRRYPVAEEIGPPFDQAITPGESFQTSRRFHIDPAAKTLDLLPRGDGLSMDTFVIGASTSLLHKRTVYRIKPGLAPV